MRCATRGVPAGVFNYVTGPGGSLGEALIGHRGRRGRHVHRQLRRRHALVSHASRRARWPRPCIAEMGGKNAAIVTRHANLADAATGHRALRVRPVGAEVLGVLARVRRAHRVRRLRRRVARRTRRRSPSAIRRVREHWMGPVIDRAAVARVTRTRSRRFTRWAARAASCTAASGSTTAISRMDTICAPTIARAPLAHPLWHARSSSRRSCSWRRSTTLDEAFAHANASEYGLTAGFYGDADETERFFDAIEAGRVLCQPPARRDDRRVAGLPAVRRVEGLGLDRQGGRARSTTCRSTCASSRRRGCGAIRA